MCALKGRAVKTWKSERKYNRVYAQHRLIYRIENMWPITKNVARMSQSCSTCCTYQFCGALALHLCLSLFHAGVHVGRSVVHIAVLGNFHPVSFSFCHQHNISFHFIYLFIYFALNDALVLFHESDQQTLFVFSEERSCLALRSFGRTARSATFQRECPLTS